MRQVIRPPDSEPSVLHQPFTSGKNKGKTELEVLRDAFAAGGKMDYGRYKEDEVKEGLDRLFHGKCAYCESFYAGTQPVDVEHYRPKGKVDGDKEHPGYWWLAMDWENLLPSCIDCNRKRRQKTPRAPDGELVTLLESGEFDRQVTLSTGKATAFPLVTGTERAAEEADDVDAEARLLIDPTRDDPAEDLVFYIDRENLVSLVLPKPLTAAAHAALPAAAAPGSVEAAALAAGVSPKGAVSIRVYGLNRLELVQARTRVLRDLEFLYLMAVNLGTLLAEVEARAAADRVLLAAPPASMSAKLFKRIEEDVAFAEPLIVRLAAYRKAMFDRMAAMADERAPHAAVARAWMRMVRDEAEEAAAAAAAGCAGGGAGG